MFTRNIICILFLVALTTSKITLLNLPQNFTPKDESEYASYLQVMIGHYVESAQTTQNIKMVIYNERPSLMNAPEKVVLILATISSKDSAPQEGAGLNVEGTELREVVEKHQNAFSVRMMPNVRRDRLQQEITKLQAQGSLVNVIIGEEKTIQKLAGVLSHSEQVSSKRRLQSPTSPTTDSTYLIKFFFSLIFILVIVACVGFISQNEGKKDTLLYAKFIADVGGR